VGNENDAGYTENIFEFLSACGVDHEFRHLGVPHTRHELLGYQQDSQNVSLLGFNSQIDHAWAKTNPFYSLLPGTAFR
jgi:hypothetical protein